MKIFLLSVACAFTLFMASYRMVETPPTWMDEGAIVQVAMNLADHGTYTYQVAPDSFVSAGFLTTSYPVIVPLALVFKIFGVGLLQARTLMLLFILFFVSMSYCVLRKVYTNEHVWVPVISLVLLASFAPLYGHGKNVLGEVPGLTFFLSMLYFIGLMERGSYRWGTVLSAGLCGGLAMATKPIYFILIAPALLLTIFILYHRRMSIRQKLFFIFGCILPLMCWYLVQFKTEPLVAVFSGNPDGISSLTLFVSNVKRFVTEFQPIYFLGLMVAWLASLCIRIKRKVPISMVESIAVIFSAINICAYTGTLGYYRYFFPGEIVALMFLPSSLYIICNYFRIRVPILDQRFFYVCITILVIFQTYQTLFHSWVSEYATSERSALLEENIASVPQDKKILFYNVPETVIFLPHDMYFQYFRFADIVVRGEENLTLLKLGVPDMVLVDQKFDTKILPPGYQKKSSFDKYILFEKSVKMPK